MNQFWLWGEYIDGLNRYGSLRTVGKTHALTLPNEHAILAAQSFNKTTPTAYSEAAKHTTGNNLNIRTIISD